MRVLPHSVAAAAALCIAPVALAGVALRPRWRVGWKERLGIPALPAAPGRIWIHAASVGETLAALPLHEAWAVRGRPTLASTVTLTGQEVLRRQRPTLERLLAPIDHPWCVSAALARVRPRALVLLETELWPSWIAAAGREGIPVVVVSGRLSDRSFPRYQRFGFALGSTLRRLARVGARSDEDAERFRQLGVPEERVVVTGDLKLEAGGRDSPLSRDLEQVLGSVPLLVAGSTHPGEDQAMLLALAAAEAAGFSLALVLAPRHPERAEALESAVRARGRTVRRRSHLSAAPLAPGEVLLLDTVGELGALYRRATVVFVGGSLVDRGGQNVLEPIFAGRPVLFGPHTQNFRAAVELLLRCGAGRQVETSDELARAVIQELRETARAAERVERAWAELAPHRGAAERSVELVEQVIEAAE